MGIGLNGRLAILALREALRTSLTSRINHLHQSSTTYGTRVSEMGASEPASSTWTQTIELVELTRRVLLRGEGNALHL